MRTRAFAALALGVLLPGSAGAFPLGGMQAEPKEVVVEAEAAFDGIPPTGYVPVRVTVSNGLQAALRFGVERTCDASGHMGGARVDRGALLVPAQGSTTLDVLLPMGPQARNGYTGWGSCSVVLDGLGGRRAFSVSGRVPGPRDGDRPTVGFSKALPEPAERLAGAVPGEVHVIKVDPALLGGDWRGLSGLDALWLLPPDLDALSGEARAAVTQWVVQGGELVLVAPTGPDAAAFPGLPFTAGDLELGRFGLGRVQTLRSEDDASADLDALMSSLRARVVVSAHARRGKAVMQTSLLEAAVDKVEIRRPLILGFLALFVLLIGPVNFFFLAPRTARMRLLVTTPALGVLASVGLMLVILLQDGVGGEGQRAQVILLMPRLNLALRGQHELSRTGLVARTTFSVPEAVDLVATVEEEEEGRTLEREGAAASGDWFRTRAVQGHWLQALAPSRERVEEVAPGAEGRPPTLVSSLSSTLGPFVYTDLEGRQWRGEGLAPGGTARLSATDGLSGLDEASARLPGPVRGALQASLPRAGWLVGEVSAGAEPWPTLPSVRYEDAPPLLAVEVRAPEVSR